MKQNKKSVSPIPVHKTYQDNVEGYSQSFTPFKSPLKNSSKDLS